MRRHAIALALAAALSFSLAGCFGQAERRSELQDALVDFAESASKIAQTLEDIQWDKTSRAVVTDAATGEEVAELTDQAQIDEIFSPLTGQNGLAPTPDAPEEYVVHIWQPATVTLVGGSDSDEVEVVRLTTYEGSEVVTLTVVPIDLSINLSNEANVADAIRALV